MAIKVAAFSGSLRKDSFNTRLVRAFATLAPEGVSVDLVPIGDLPFINEDLEAEMPGTVLALHRRIEAADAVFIRCSSRNFIWGRRGRNSMMPGS